MTELKKPKQNDAGQAQAWRQTAERAHTIHGFIRVLKAQTENLERVPSSEDSPTELTIFAAGGSCHHTYRCGGRLTLMP